MAATKNTAPANATNGAPIAGDGLPDFSTWEKEETGFAPYWTPSAKKAFYARPVGRDDTDPEFTRFLMQSLQPSLICHSGPKEEAVEIEVKSGDTFTISVYKQLDAKFNEYMASGFFPPVRVEAVKEVKTKTVGQTCWIFDLRVSPEDKKRLQAYRMQQSQLQAAAINDAKRIGTADADASAE